MSPTAALQHAIDAAVTTSVAVGSRYRTIQEYIAQGRPIPDDLLPGRLLAHLVHRDGRGQPDSSRRPNGSA
jgi:hypothetical protein